MNNLSEIAYDLPIPLNAEQRKAVEDTEGQLLVLSGAGSGKTRVLTARIAYLIEQRGVSPREILAITFTKKAAKEMLDRITGILGDRSSGVWAMTFHAFCARILRYHADVLGFTSDFSIYDESDSLKLIKRICGEKGITDSKKKESIACYISEAKTFGLTPAQFEKEKAYVKDVQTVSEVFSAYNARLKESNAMDYDDLLLNAKELLLSSESVLKRYQERFRYVHVDEFQDINSTQYDLIRLIAGGHGNIFAVGDEDQSIYGWRGARIDIILNFEKDFPAAKIYKLEQNYRSTAHILNCANRVIANNKQRIGDKKLWTSKSGGAPVSFCSVGNDRDEADFVVQKISMLLAEGYKYRDFAILTRINALTRPFEERLNLYGLPYKVYGGVKFYERKEIKDMLAYMRIAVNPKDTEAILRVINFPARGIGDGTTEKLLEYCRGTGKDLIDAILEIDFNTAIAPSAAKKISAFKDIVLSVIRNVNQLSSEEFLKQLIKDAGIETHYKACKEDEWDRFENINELVTAVRDFSRDNPGSGIGDFLQSIALISDTDSIQDDDYITIATVHAVKGLEFPVVFLIALEESIFPLQRAVDENDIEEERRLMYVAVTRASERLFCSYASRRFRFNQVVYNMKSRFITEMQGEQKKQTIPQQPRASVSGGQGGGLNLKGLPPKPQTAAPRILNTDFSAFTAGRQVSHAKFGVGTIVETFGEGVDKSALINFPGIGTKKFLLLIANLTLTD